MNEIINSLLERKSVRVFLDKPITKELREQILLSAAAAPTAGNQQLYSILEITDQVIKTRLSVTCDNQPFIAQAPLVLIFCADCQKWYDAFTEANCNPRRPGPGDLMLAVDDAAIAAQNAVTAAASLGIGSCYIGDIMEQYEEHKKLLNLPDYVFPAVMLVFGYPTEQQQKRDKPKRCRLEDIVHENQYHRKSGSELRDMFRDSVGGKGYDEWMQAFCTRKYNSDFSLEMSRSVCAYLDHFK